MRSLKQQARFAGCLYLALAVTAPIGLLIVPGQVIVKDNAAVTAENLRTMEGFFRLGIASELVHQALGIFLVMALYTLFRNVHEGQARLLVILGALVSVPIVFVNVLNEIAALTLAKGAPFLTAFTKPQLESLAYLFVRLHSQGITVASIFWGLWLFPFGWLVIRSGFIPRFLGYLLMTAGTAYLIAAIANLALPSLKPVVDPFLMPLESLEVPIIFWLVIWGAVPGKETASR